MPLNNISVFLSCSCATHHVFSLECRPLRDPGVRCRPRSGAAHSPVLLWEAPCQPERAMNWLEMALCRPERILFDLRRPCVDLRLRGSYVVPERSIVGLTGPCFGLRGPYIGLIGPLVGLSRPSIGIRGASIGS